MVCAVKIAFSASGSWEECEHAPIKGQSPQEFVVDLGASGPEVLFHAPPSRRLFTRSDRAGKSSGSMKAAKSAASFGEYVSGVVRCLVLH